MTGRLPVAKAAPTAAYSRVEIEISLGDETRMSKVEALDPSALESLREFENKGGPHLVGALTSLFLRDSVTRLHLLRKAVASSDAIALERTAQTLKGSSASVGATAMSLMCGALEEKGRTGTLEGASEILTLVEEEFERTRMKLEIEAHSKA